MSQEGNFFDRIMVGLLNRPYIKARLAPQPSPRFIGLEAEGFSIDEFFASMDDVQKEKIALSVSWIYSAINLLANKIVSSELHVMDAKDSRIKDHEFKLLLRKPTEFFGLSYLLRYLVFTLSLSDKGAIWYLAPRRGSKDDIAEIWPIIMSRVTIIKSRNGYIDGFQYKPSGSEKVYRIDPSSCIWFRYADPHDWWKSYPPLRAMIDALAIELGISASQNKFYTEGRGVPLSVVSVNPDMSATDFTQFRADLKNDWDEAGTTLAIARGGTLDVKSIGLTQRDMEVITSQEFTRDKLDAAILGIPLRGQDMGRGDGLKQADKFINDNTAHPLHVMIAEEITLQALDRHWDDGSTARFDDIRATDRALTIQENTIRSRWMTINEMRATEGLTELEDDILGELLVPLANNPAYISQLQGLGNNKPGGGGGVNPAHIEGLPGVGNLGESQHFEAAANQAAGGSISEMRRIAINAELKRFRTVAKRNFKASGNAMSRIFGTNVIPDDMFTDICADLEEAATLEDIDEVFAKSYL